ncbi:Unconventional prefoldin RPB5 interactor, partial [Ophiophagus hannah]
VVTSCQEKIQHWKKVESDYEALQDRLNTLPDKLSYDIMVPFGPLAFMPGRLVHTNEVTVLLGDNWFAKCSAKQAGGLVEHRKKRVRKMLDDLGKVMKNFESRAEFTADLQKMSDAAGDVVDIREITESGELEMKGKQRTAHKPHSKPKICAFEGNVDESGTDKKPNGDIKSEEDLWARLDELERQEQILGELSRISQTSNAKAEGASSSEEDREDKKLNLDVLQKDEKPNTQGNFQKDVTDFESFGSQVNGPNHYSSDDEDDFAISENAVPTIYFSHTVRINTGKNTTLKFSEKKEEAKRKRKNSNGNGHGTTELPNIKTPADIYRVFVDVVNGEYVPRKSILKSRSRENSVCSDTSESSTTEFDDRRGILRSLSYEDATHSDNRTVVEKEPLSPSTIPHPVLAHPVLPTILERKSEEILCEASEETTKRVSKFKAARMQQKS